MLESKTLRFRELRAESGSSDHMEICSKQGLPEFVER